MTEELPPIVCSRVVENDQLVIVILSPTVIGVSSTKFKVMPNLKRISTLIQTDIWINANKDNEGAVSVICPNEFTEMPDLEETTKVALETALWLWKDWSPELRHQLKPQPPIFSQGIHLT